MTMKKLPSGKNPYRGGGPRLWEKGNKNCVRAPSWPARPLPFPDQPLSLDGRRSKNRPRLVPICHSAWGRPGMVPRPTMARRGTLAALYPSSAREAVFSFLPDRKALNRRSIENSFVHEGPRQCPGWPLGDDVREGLLAAMSIAIETHGPGKNGICRAGFPAKRKPIAYDEKMPTGYCLPRVRGAPESKPGAKFSPAPQEKLGSEGPRPWQNAGLRGPTPPPKLTLGRVSSPILETIPAPNPGTNPVVKGRPSPICKFENPFNPIFWDGPMARVGPASY